MEVSALTKATQTDVVKTVKVLANEVERSSEEGSSRVVEPVRDRVATMPQYWRIEELRDAQASDDELGVIHHAKVTPEASKPTWNDISYESLGSKYYLNEWARLRVRNGLLYSSLFRK